MAQEQQTILQKLLTRIRTPGFRVCSPFSFGYALLTSLTCCTIGASHSAEPSSLLGQVSLWLVLLQLSPALVFL